MQATTSQSDFVASLLDPAAAAPAGVTTMRGSPDAARFDVYRNNVMVSLIGALEQKFPVCRQIVGEEFFRDMARLFVRQTKPSSPLIFLYGDDFPTFIDGFEPARPVPYLGDAARLEVAWMRAYHAADGTPLDIAAIAAIGPEKLAASRIVLHPSASLLRSRWPVGSIWEAHQHKPVAKIGRSSAETVLVVRPGAEVNVHIAPPSDRTFAEALFAGATLGDAAQAGGLDGDFDFGRALVGLASLGIISGLQPASESDN